ncbi:MAG: VCBS repeat-containing protein [bacterium]|nr:VCBS repeat-containing protein [bacterium]
MGIEAGHDERPRGVIALDARDGRELWRYLTGAKPIALNFHIVDLDGDGRQEICLLGAGVSNLEEGEEVAGFSDDHARLFVLNDDGSLRWQRALGAAPASGWVEPVDLDADGRNELVVAAWLTELGSEALFVLDGDGAVLASARRWRPGPEPGGHGRWRWRGRDGVAVVRRRGAAVHCVAHGHHRRPAGCDRRPRQVALVGNVVGDAALEVLLGGAGGWNWLVDETLKPLALLHDPDFRPLGDGTYLRGMPGGERRLVVLGGRGLASAEFVLEENPRRVPWELIAAGTATVGAAGTAWRWRRRRLTPAALRALRLQLLERLVGERHGAIGPLTAAERLAERLLASFAKTGGDRALLEQRIRELLREMLDVGVPQLAAAADVAELAGLDEKALGEARQALDELKASLLKIADDWDGATPADEAVTASAVALRPLVESARLRFRNLCKLVAADFTASPGAILTRARWPRTKNPSPDWGWRSRCRPTRYPTASSTRKTWRSCWTTSSRTRCAPWNRPRSVGWPWNGDRSPT